MSSNPSPRSGTPVLPATTTTTTTALPDQLNLDLPLKTAAARTLDPTTTANTIPSTSSSSAFIPPWRRPTINIDGVGNAARRLSVQFVPSMTAGSTSRSSSAKPPSMRTSLAGIPGASSNGAKASALSRRMSSPPPPAQFQSKVSFDTFSNPAASDFSLTLNRKHRDYEYTKRSRTFLCGTDTNEYSDTALEWLIDELVDDGDEVVCLRVVEKDSKEAEKWSRGQGEKGYRKEAARFLEEIEKKNTDDRAISLVLEFSIGKVQETIQQMIRIYEPAMLVVGTRGRSLTGYQGLLSSGSVSKYCLQYSPVPVVVVRPSSKREAKKRKRLQDPTRSGYRDILDKSEDAARGRGGHLLDVNNRLSIMGSDLGALGEFDPQDDEARRVAEAIGYRHTGNGGADAHRASSLSRINSALSDTAGDPTSSPGRLMKSPEMGVVDSPGASDDDDVSEAEIGPLEESIRPEDEAAMLAYERAQKVFEEEREEAEARQRREERMNSCGRGSSRKSRSGGGGEGDSGGAAVLDIFEKLNRGMKS